MLISVFKYLKNATYLISITTCIYAEGYVYTIHVILTITTEGHAFSQAVSHHPVIEDRQFKFQASPCGACKKTGIRTVYCLSVSFY